MKKYAKKDNPIKLAEGDNSSIHIFNRCKSHVIGDIHTNQYDLPC